MARSIFMPVLLSIVVVTISFVQAFSDEDGFFFNPSPIPDVHEGSELDVTCGVDRSKDPKKTYTDAFWMIDLGDEGLRRHGPWAESGATIPKHYVFEGEVDGGIYSTTLRITDMQNWHSKRRYFCVILWGTVYKRYDMQLQDVQPLSWRFNGK